MAWCFFALGQAAKVGFHGSGAATLAKAVRPVIIQTYSYRENGFIGGNEAKEETGIVF